MPTSSVMLEKYNKLVSIQDLGRFNGSQVADSLQIIDNFVNGIAKIMFRLFCLFYLFRFIASAKSEKSCLQITNY